MTRSTWKGPFVDLDVYKKAVSFQKSRKNSKIRIWSRRTVILPVFIGLKFEVYNGKMFIPVLVSEDMVGHKFGEFASTRKACIHKK